MVTVNFKIKTVILPAKKNRIWEWQRIVIQACKPQKNHRHVQKTKERNTFTEEQAELGGLF